MTPRMSYPPIALILFGASGDLVWRKLAPALFDLYGDGWLPERWMRSSASRGARWTTRPSAPVFWTASSALPAIARMNPPG
jgi:glucose-6-phosphate 1-dehydrogenase